MANYVDPEEFRVEILLSKERDELTPRTVEMFQLMANEASKRLRYKNEEDRKDVIAFALMDLIKYWRSFNPEEIKISFCVLYADHQEWVCERMEEAASNQRNRQIVDQ